MTALDILSGSGIGNPALMAVGLGDGGVDRKAEHGREAGGKVGLDPVEQNIGRGPGRIEAVIFDGLVTLCEGITEGGRLEIKISDDVGPVFLRGYTEQDQGAHGGPEVCPRIARLLHQIPRHLVEEAARGIDMFSKRSPLKILDDGDPCIGGAGTELPLVLNGRAPFSQVFFFWKPCPGRFAQAYFSEHRLEGILLPEGFLIRAQDIVFRRIIPEVGIIRPPPHSSFCLDFSHDVCLLSLGIQKK